MQIQKYLEEHQHIIYRTFVNSLKNKTLSHAYLLVGNPGTPLLEVAKFLAKSIICDDPSPLACENCITCLRVESNNYPDVIILDGSKGTIKKEDVLNIESRFEKSAFESKGIMIYIINLVENMGVEAVNSMLKFLEEPDSEVYAFLTTNNQNNVLPTIISRCQTLHLKTVDRQKIINESVEMNVERKDAELLSYFYNDAELIFNLMNPHNNEEEDEKDSYLKSRDAFEDLLNALKDGQTRDAMYIIDKDVVPSVKTKESMRFFIDMLTQAFEDLVNIKYSRDITLQSYDTILKVLANKLPHLDETLVEILKQRNLVNLNVNISLQLDYLIMYITKEQL